MMSSTTNIMSTLEERAKTYCCAEKPGKNSMEWYKIIARPAYIL